MTTDRQVLCRTAAPPTAAAIDSVQAAILRSDQRPSRNAPEYIRLLDYGGVVVRLQDYDRVVEGGADRVRALVEQQQELRRRIASHKPWRGFSFEAGLLAATLMMMSAALLRAC